MYAGPRGTIKLDALTGLDLKVLRIRRCLRQYDVASRLGIHPARLSEIESGRREAPPDLLCRLMELLGGGEAHDMEVTPWRNRARDGGASDEERR